MAEDNTATVAAPVVAAAPLTPVVETAKPWYDGADAETVGYLQNRGLDKKTAAEAAIAAVAAHREAEKFVGAPTSQLLRIADPKDEAATAAMWGRLGYPGAADKYDFSGIKNPDGSDLDPAFVERSRARADSLRLPQDVAQRLVAAEVKDAFDGRSADVATRTAALDGQKAELKKDWGVNHDAMMLVAKNTAMKLGATPEAVAALETQVGYAAVMKMFANIGSKIGEDSFITNLNPAVPGVMTREQAVARKGELMRDDAWAKRYMAGGAQEIREMTGLLTIIVGDDTEASRAA